MQHIPVANLFRKWYLFSQVIENKILSCLKDSDHVAIMFDESTDCTVTE